MIRKSRARASSLFLMELILAILFFSAASAICVQFFVRSHLLSRESDSLSHAVIECSSAAEAVNASDSIPEAAALLQSLYPDGRYPETEGREHIAAGDIQIYYDDSFQPCAKESSVYVLILQLTQENNMLNTDIQMWEYSSWSAPEQGSAVYELDIEHHIAGRTGYEKK